MIIIHCEVTIRNLGLNPSDLHPNCCRKCTIVSQWWEYLKIYYNLHSWPISWREWHSWTNRVRTWRIEPKNRTFCKMQFLQFHWNEIFFHGFSRFWSYKLGFKNLRNLDLLNVEHRRRCHQLIIHHNYFAFRIHLFYYLLIEQIYKIDGKSCMQQPNCKI